MWLVLTVAVFLFANWVSQKVNNPLVNPLLISIAILIPMLIWLGVPYEQYYTQSRWINDLLQPAVVALAYPLYEQLPQIRKNWRIIVLACTLGSVMSMLTSTVIAAYLQTEITLVASLLGKSVTTPISMEVSSSLGGEPAITAILVLLVGLFGAMFAYPIYNLLNITHPIAKGLTTGTVSHALGTAACAGKDAKDAAFSSLALVICGLITSILAPPFYTFAMWLML